MPPKTKSEVVIANDDEVDIQTYVNKEVAGLDNYVPSSWDDMISYAEDNYGEIIEFEGSVWEVVDKKELIGVPFIIADARIYDGKWGSAVAIMLLTEEPLKGHDRSRYIINDGSTGVYAQVTQMVQSAKRKSGIMCPNGLRASSYEYDEEDFDGNITKKPATTYYVA